MSLAPALRALMAAVLACLLTASTAFAADGEGTRLDLKGEGAGAQAASQGATGGDLVRTIVGLAIVLTVIVGLHWVLKQIRAAKEEGASGTGLETLATLPLGANRSLHLVRLGAEVVLVGTGEGGVTPIRSYPEAEARALGLLPDEMTVHAELVGLPAPSPRDASWVGTGEAAKHRPAAKRLVDELRKRTVR